MEHLFKKWLKDNDAEVEALIFRSPREWLPDVYIFRFRFGDGEWSGPNYVPWDMEAFARVSDIIKGAKP